MNSFDDPYDVQAARIAATQREAGWSEYSIAMYAKEQKAIWCDEKGELACKMLLGAGLAQDNSRFGVK